MPRLINTRTGVAVSCSEGTAARLRGRDWVDADDAAQAPPPPLADEPSDVSASEGGEAAVDADDEGPELDAADLADEPAPAPKRRTSK